MLDLSPPVNRFALLIAEFFYCGRFPKAPGTAGSLGSLVIWLPAVLFFWPLWVRLALLVLLFALGVWASRYAIAHYGDDDPPQVVIDEVVGQGLPFLVITSAWWQILGAVVLFRFFDIVKPWPIKTLEKGFGNAPLGIMIDDVMAGVYAMVVMLLLRFLF
jgi:phosphatidylglycerophosphatase A